MAESSSILVTGGGGYLGSIMVPMLLGAGHRVTVLDRFLYRESALFDICAEPGFSVVRGDARDERIVMPLIRSADIVIPLAALVGAPLCNRDRLAAVTTNRDAVVMLTRLLSPAQRILLPVTNSGYGIGTPGVPCTEESPLRPISLYGQTKVQAEQAVLERGNAISFRLATVFGMAPRMRVDLLVNDFVYRAVKDSALVLFEADFKRNYIHIRDVASAFIHGIKRFSDMRDQTYNVGLSDANLSKRELCEAIRIHLPRFVFTESQVGEDPDKRDYIVLNEKIARTGFQTSYSLDDGIRELIKGYAMLHNGRYDNG